MTYRFLSCFCMMIVGVTLGYGQQRQLHYEDKSGPFDIFTGSGSEAGMVLICAEAIELSFASNKDKTVNVFKTEVKGSDKYYYLRMPVGESYNDRKLTIYAAKYAPLVIEPKLQIKELKTLFLYDPDVILQGCYNQTMKEGLEIFRMAQYIDAKAKYRLAAECSDAPASVLDDIEQKIAVIDTIIKRRRVADEYFTVGNFAKAYSNYQTVYAYNPDDRYAELKMAESRTQMGKKPGSQQKPKTTVSDGQGEVKEFKEKSERRKQNVFAISYETMSAPTIGLSFGWYRAGKVGIYFAGHAAGDMGFWNGIYREDVNLSLGTTFRLFNFSPGKPSGAWLSVGGGYTYAYIEEEYYFHDSGTGIAPEAGVLFKFGWLVMKYTFQYRFFKHDEHDNYNYGYYNGSSQLPKTNHLLGIGVCF